MTQLSLTIEEVCSVTGLGRTKIYEALHDGLLRGKKWGKRTVILKADLEEFLSKLGDYPVRGGAQHD